MFCIVCGKEAKVGNFCEDCFLQRMDLFDIEDFSMQICDCGSYFDRGWQKAKSIDDAINERIEKKIKTDNKILETNISFKIVGNRVLATVRCKGFIKPCKRKKIVEKNILILLKRRKCDNCIKLSGGYSEAILQIRGENKDRIMRSINLPLCTVEKTKDGYDVKFIRRSDARNVLKQLKGFEIKKSFKFIGMKKGRKILKDYYSIR